jgi:hypothetical protein
MNVVQSNALTLEVTYSVLRKANLIHLIFSQPYETPYIIYINVINALLVVGKFILSKHNYQGQVTSSNYYIQSSTQLYKSVYLRNQIDMYSRNHFQSQIHSPCSLTRSIRASPLETVTVAILPTFPFQISYPRASVNY